MNAPSTFPSWLAREERLAERAPTGVPATLSCPRAGTAAAVVTDASALGCRVRTDMGGGVGSYLTLLAGGASASGWVAWRRGDEMGIDFSEPLSPVALAAFTAAVSD